MKNALCKGSSALLNLIEGFIGVFAFVLVYAFIFEKYNTNHDVGLGLMVLFFWLLILITPNLMYKFGAKFKVRDVILFQLLPFIIGAAAYFIAAILHDI